MARNGAGTYSRTHADYVYDTVISETDVNGELNDIATALTNSIAKDGQTTPTANLPMGGYKLTGLGSGSAATDSAHLGQIQAQAYIWCGTAGGTANDLTLAPAPTITAYAAGQCFRFIAGASPNTGATTVAVSGLTTKAIQNYGSALAAADIAASKMYEIVYDGTAFQLRSVIAVALPVPVAQGGTGATTAAAARTNLGAAGLADNNTFTGNQSFGGTLALTGDISPSQITSDQNDYNPTGLSSASVLRLNSDASRNITGLAGGADGRTVVLCNIGSQNIVIKDESASSTAANRFALGGDITVGGDYAATLVYDSTSSRWRCVGVYIAAGGAAPTVQVFTASGTWTKPAGCSAVVVEVVAGGGGGGGCSAVVGGALASGGGGGGYARKRIAVASLGATETVTIGAAGAAGSTAGGNGGNGGTSSFGAHCSATGGTGGTGKTATATITAGAAGGSGSGGDININGGAGKNSGDGSAAQPETFGDGGDSEMGRGGVRTSLSTSSTAGTGGNGYGAGGSGGWGGGGGAVAGGAGTAGLIIVTEFY